ncbi:type II toxin-antitoxin system HicA family toxin [Prosthecobacter sp. SYSU 5D2]
MPALPIISGAEAVKAFGKDGWQPVRQRGSHIILIKDGSQASLSVPNHRELARGTLRSLIRDADLTTEEFIELL